MSFWYVIQAGPFRGFGLACKGWVEDFYHRRAGLALLFGRRKAEFWWHLWFMGGFVELIHPTMGDLLDRVGAWIHG
jgi:hypothetical protein